MTTDDALDALDELLAQMPATEEGMTASEFDGYCAGLVAGPGEVAPEKWLKRVWGRERRPPFEAAAECDRAVAMLKAHYREVAAALDPPDYAYGPVFDVDTRTDETLWEIWAAGFGAAMMLDRPGWKRLEADPATASAVETMRLLVDIAEARSRLTKAEIDAYILAAPELISDCVRTINAARFGMPAPAFALPGAAAALAAATRKAKVGRNDPCPCGSGRKYKRCCGAG